MRIYSFTHCATILKPVTCRDSRVTHAASSTATVCYSVWSILWPCTMTLFIMLSCNNLDTLVSFSTYSRRRRGPVGRVSDLRSRGCGFESRPGTRRENSGQVFTPMCLCSPSSINWYRPKGGGACGWGVKAGMVRVWVAGKTV